jgi:hypothetical protein
MTHDPFIDPGQDVGSDTPGIGFNAYAAKHQPRDRWTTDEGRAKLDERISERAVGCVPARTLFNGQARAQG